MGVIWHGTYLRYFEDGREAFGREYGLTYLNVYENGFYIPIVKSEIDHKSIVQYGDEIEIKITLIPTPAAKIIFEYEVYNVTRDALAATGKTVQIFMDAKTHELHLGRPNFYDEWLNDQGIK